jgi:hypothetical protein
MTLRATVHGGERERKPNSMLDSRRQQAVQVERLDITSGQDCLLCMVPVEEVRQEKLKRSRTQDHPLKVLFKKLRRPQHPVIPT